MKDQCLTTTERMLTNNTKEKEAAKQDSVELFLKETSLLFRNFINFPNKT
jgi:hypothetical protein